MERAPPPPPLAPKETPKLYMTPHMAKRKDGLCPSLLQFQGKNGSPTTEKPGHVVKAYQTNSELLVQIKERDSVPRAVMELQTIIEVVNKALKSLCTDSDKLLIAKLKFKPEGCIWKLSFHPALGNDAHVSYRMEVRCLANLADEPDSLGNQKTNYMIESSLIPNELIADENDVPSTLPPPNLAGYKEAKTTYEIITVAVRKSVVRLEFPNFPHGGGHSLFREIYQLNARIKSGSFATVCRGTHRESGRRVAVKCVLRKDLPPSDDAAIYDEVAILSSLHHPHIVPILDFFDEKDCYFIVMELMCGGDLFDRIGKKKSYSEADARDLVVKMLKAVAICHQKNIAHCDMKPKNLLLVSEEDDSYIKVADFGFAARVHRPKSLVKQCGTPFFVAPEILTRKPYDQQSDMWSVGCIVFLLISGSLPFVGRSQKELFRRIVSGKFEFKEEDWAGVSEDAKDMVSKMLTVNPDERITAKKALLHPWLKVSADRLSKNGLNSTSQKLKTFNAKMKLRSVMIAVDTISLLQRMGGMSGRHICVSGHSVASPPPSSSTPPSLPLSKSSATSCRDKSATTSRKAPSTSQQRRSLLRRLSRTTSKQEGMVSL